MLDELRPNATSSGAHAAKHPSPLATVESLVRSLDRSVLGAALYWRPQLLGTTEIMQNATAVSRFVAETMAVRQTYLVDQFMPIRAATDRALAVAIERLYLRAFTTG